MKLKNFTWAVLVGLLTTTSVWAVVGKPGLPLPADVEKGLNLNAIHAPKFGLGTQVTQKKVNVMKAVYNFAVLGGASGTTLILKDAAGGQAVLPANAIVTNILIDGITVPTAGTTTALVAIGVNSAADLRAATLFSTYTGLIGGIPQGGNTTAVKVTTSAKAVTATLTLGSLTAGKFNVFLEYYLSNL